jgi:hypothetical protein
MENYNTFCLTNGGQKGQEVRLFATLLYPQYKGKAKDGSICLFWGANLTYTGKTSNDVAAGMHQSLKKFGHPNNKQISGSTSNSGAGTPKSYAKSCNSHTPNLATVIRQILQPTWNLAQPRND